MSDQLSRLIKTILDPVRPPYSLRSEVLELKEILLKLASMEFNMTSDISVGETRTESGLAVSPAMAVMCVDDVARTVAFIRGTHAAIKEMKARFPNEPVRVLYAGCGPLATLAIPQLAAFSLTDISFTLIDINADSMTSARSIIDALGYSSGVEAYVVGDIMSYLIDHSREPHIVLIEVMNAALEAEPQVSVARHLISQCPNALLVPERIDIRLTLVNQSQEFSFDGEKPKRDRIEIGSFFSLDRGSIGSWNPDESSQLPAATLQLPVIYESRYEPMLFTDIHVFGDHRLTDYDSGLSLPKRLASLGRFGPGDILKFGYVLGKYPHLVAEKMSGPEI